MLVMEILPRDIYWILDIARDGLEIYATVIHVSDLKSWKVVETSD